MKNQYIIKGKRAVIFVDTPTNYDGGYAEVEIDKTDLELVKSFPGSWYGFVHKHNHKLYARGTRQTKIPDGFTSAQPLLHRVIMNPLKGQNTIHKDGNTLNCCKDNLVNVAIGEKYTPPDIDPKLLPVVRGVHWREDKQCFEAKAYYKNKGYYLGLYPLKKWKKANKAVETFRKLGPETYFKFYSKGETNFKPIDISKLQK